MSTSSLSNSQEMIIGFDPSLGYSDSTIDSNSWASKLNWLNIAIWSAGTLFSFGSWYLLLKLLF